MVLAYIKDHSKNKKPKHRGNPEAADWYVTRFDNESLPCEVLMVGDGKLDNFNKAIAEMACYANSALNERHESELCLFTLALPIY